MQDKTDKLTQNANKIGRTKLSKQNVGNSNVLRVDKLMEEIKDFVYLGSRRWQ